MADGACGGGREAATVVRTVSHAALPSGRALATRRDNSSWSVRAGTLGVGLEISHLLSDHFGVRVGGNYFSLKQKQTEQSIAYDATVKLQAFTGLLDWYPGRRGVFHFSAGAISNPMTLNGVGTPETGATYTINSVDYTASQIGTFTASAKYASVLPYVGLGFGTPASKSHGIGVVFDVGAAIGKPTVNLSSSNAANVSGLQANINAETAKVRKVADKLPLWPVVSLGLTYRF